MFHSLKAAGPSYPQRLILIADWGLSHNSKLLVTMHTLKKVLQSLLITPCWISKDAKIPTYNVALSCITEIAHADTWLHSDCPEVASLSRLESLLLPDEIVLCCWCMTWAAMCRLIHFGSCREECPAVHQPSMRAVHCRLLLCR